MMTEQDVRCTEARRKAWWRPIGNARGYAVLVLIAVLISLVDVQIGWSYLATVLFVEACRYGLTWLWKETP